MKKALCLVLALVVLGGAVFAQATSYKESPVLADLVKAGKIPTVDKRVPKDALVVKPVEKVGKFGGTWRLAFRPGSAWSLWGYVLKENEIRYMEDFKTLIPSLLKGFQASPDNKVFTFTLRQGVKWSDGDAYDADDYAFWWEDVVNNADISPSKPAVFMAGGKLGKFEKVDQYTIRFTFEVAYSTFLHRLAQPRYSSSSTGPIALPSHYLKQFHPKYASAAAIEKATKDGGFSTWMAMYAAKANNVSNPEVPVLCAWRNLDINTGAVMRFERNAYYWKVDTAGNQLPYIDKLEMYFYEDANTCLLKSLAGETDFQYREVASLANYPTLMKGADKGGYRIVPTETMHSNMYTTFLNRNSTDPIKKQLYDDFRFRQALSLGIDRNQINDVLLNGMSDIMQVGPPVGAASYDDAVAKMYTEFDIVKANQLLDQIGLKWDAKKEWRLGPDGKPLSFNKIFYVAWPPFQGEAQDLIKEGYRKIGLNVNNKVLERTLWETTMRANDWDLSAYATDTGGGAYLLGNGALFPSSDFWLTLPAWGLWYTSLQKAGFEPPAEVKKLRVLYEEYMTTATQARMVEIEKEATKIYVTNLLAIGVMSRPKVEIYYVASKKLKNVPAKLMDDVTYHIPAQFYFE
jgi:peptide/nickel transport system substrate-binding protein